MITINGDPINVTKFPDGTSQVWKLDERHLKKLTADVNWRFEDEAEIMHLSQLALLLVHRMVKAYLFIEYLPYARQDKPIDNHSTFALRAFAPILNIMGWHRITICDPHSTVATDLIWHSDSVFYLPRVFDCSSIVEADVFCFPDAGALQKYGPIFSEWECISAEKVRDQNTGHVTTGRIIGDVKDKRVLIIDDICDGGATFIGLAARLREEGAKDVCLFVSHGLFTKGAKVLKDGGISRVFTPKGEVLP